MYVTTHRSAKGTKMFGVVAATAFTVGLAGLFTSMNFAAEKVKVNTTELVLLSPPPPPPPLEDPTPTIERVKDTPAPPEPPPLVAPEIDFVPEELPVITAPVADPIPVPEPVMVAPSPAPVSQIRPKLISGDKPEYPSAARRAGEQGTTHLKVCVSSGGRVTSVSIAGSSGSPRLDDAAAKWLRGERFTP
ncbi:MAG: TonB family protein, partial [Hyphomonadaceae bacterium]